MRIKKQSNNITGGIEPLLEQLISDGIPEEAVDIYKGRNRVVKYTLPSSGYMVNIKGFRVPHIINRFAYGCLRPSKAERAYRNALDLIDLGISTPTPLGFIEERRGLMLGRSFFVSQQVEGYTDFRELHTHPDKAILLEELAKLMVNLHRNKVWMKDFSPGNILWRKNSDGGYELTLVDINRMEFEVKDKTKWMSNFGNICDDEDDLRELAHFYARHANRPIEKITSRALQARENFLRKRRMKQKLH